LSVTCISETLFLLSTAYQDPEDDRLLEEDHSSHADLKRYSVVFAFHIVPCSCYP